MNKKIKIIELLNKIANGEELPKKIKVKEYIFEWVDIDTGKGYHNIHEKDWVIWLQDLISLDTKEELNEIVEILEDNTEDIEELLIKLLEKVKNTPDDVIEQAIDSLQEKLRKEKE